MEKYVPFEAKNSSAGENKRERGLVISFPTLWLILIGQFVVSARAEADAPWEQADYQEHKNQAQSAISKPDHKDNGSEHDHNFEVAVGPLINLSTFIVPPPLKGGLFWGVGGWAHVAVQTPLRCLNIALGGEISYLGPGSYSGGMHLGPEFHWGETWHFSISPSFVYHGGRLRYAPDGKLLSQPEQEHALGGGVETALFKRIFHSGAVEIGLGIRVEGKILKALKGHSFPEAEIVVAPGVNLGF